PASRVISGFALLVCVIGFMIDFVIGFMIDLRTFLRSFLRIFSGDFFGDFSPPSMRLARGFEGEACGSGNGTGGCNVRFLLQPAGY
ncbi:hypothetical protein JEC62_005476, partial [Escherichia coli]|nr:hypothetical protein [Escherichia coli]